MISEGDPEISKRPEGKVIEIIDHALTQVVGEFRVDPDEIMPDGYIGTVHLKDKKLSNIKCFIEEKGLHPVPDRKSTRLNSSHVSTSYAVFCLKKKKKIYLIHQRKLRIRLVHEVMTRLYLSSLHYLFWSHNQRITPILSCDISLTT